MAKFNLSKEIADVEARIPNSNYILGKGLLQPFRSTNSGSRAIMQNIQAEQRLPLMNPEPSIISTGHENRYGEMSSNYVKAKTNYVVIDKVQKYPWDTSDTRQVYCILLDPDNNVLELLPRKPYEHVSESFGYTFDTTMVDSLDTGSLIPKGTVVTKTRSFDQYNNRQDGLNLRTVYMASGMTIEDPVIVSESTAKRFNSPLIDKVRVMINDNDILLNLFGGDNLNEYKVIPDIGQEITNGMLCAVRREKKDEEALFAQSWKRLKELMISDEPYLVPDGKIIDIDIYPNNPEALEKSVYNQQLYKYYVANKNFCQNVVNIVKPLLDEKKCKMTYKMEKFYSLCLKTIKDTQYISDKVFNGIIMDITVMRVIPLHKGDKVTDRYGGKGVVSEILPDDQMPEVQLQDGTFEPVDIIYNKCTCVNRLNPGQLFETSITAVGEQVIEYICNNQISCDVAAKMIYQYINIINPHEAAEFWDNYSNMMDEDKETFIASYTKDGCIYIVTKPMTPVTLNTLEQLYKTFPFASQMKVRVRQIDSNGNYRKVYTNRLLTAGFKYIYRLKQFAEEKFSAVSLAATNIRGENTKSKASKLHKSLFSSTPVRFGEMEWEDLLHIDAVEQVIQVLMLLSSSPGARRLCEQLLTGDPLSMDIKLDDKSTSRSAELAAAYLKTMGLRLEINKIPKTRQGAGRVVVTRLPKAKETMKTVVERTPFEILDEHVDQILDLDEKSKGKLHEVVYRVKNCETLEDANNVIRDLRRAKAIHIANRGKEQFNIDSAEELIEKMKTEGITKAPTHIVGRVVVDRIPGIDKQ